MPVLTLVEAVRTGLREAMAADGRVILLGEDIGPLGGVFRATDGLQEAFGPERVIDTPMAELSIVGIGIGLALRGLRPVVEIQFGDFIWAAADQLLNEAAKIRYRSAGEWSVPLVVRAPWGAGIHGALYHSQSIEAPLAHAIGLKVVAPATAADAKGLLHAALADPDPVIFLEHKLAYRRVRDEVPPGVHPVPIGVARVARAGDDVTVVAYGWMVHEALRAAELLAGAGGPSLEVLDLRTLLPLDREAIVAAARRTGRVLVVHEDVRSLGLGAEVAALVQEEAFDALHAPVMRLTMPDVAGIPFADGLEAALVPDAAGIAAAARRLAGTRRRTAPAAGAVGIPLSPGVPQASMAMAVDLTSILADQRRRQLPDPLAYFVHAAARALGQVPEANARWEDGVPRPVPAVTMAVEEGDPAGGTRWLLLESVEALDVAGAARAIDAARAASPATPAGPRPEATVTLVVPGGSALGGVPRVWEGQMATVQVGAIAPRVVADGERAVTRPSCVLTLSGDHRVLDGAGSARLLRAMRAVLESAPEEGAPADGAAR